ncbi:MAG: ABC transporter permease [Eubacteriaceae bacterium]|nr:ABC transporter permease [Eubacteriaceae bacterium]
MNKYILKRLGIAALTLLVIVFILFMMMKLMPGTPFNDEKLPPEKIASLMAKYGLDKPLYVQFFKYVVNLVKFDFGISYVINKDISINLMLSTRVPTSIRIGLQAVALGTVIGLILGIVAALKHNTIWDNLTTVISVLGVSVPSYVFALGLLYVFAFKLKLFPLLYSKVHPFQSSLLPTFSLSMFTIASIARFTRTEMLEVLDSDYILLVESKGISGSALIFRHALRNALIPIVTVLGPLVVGLMTGSLVVEKIFSIPGLGAMTTAAIQANDYNVTIASTYIYSLMYIVIMLVVDISYGIIDPRIRLAKEGSGE